MAVSSLLKYYEVLSLLLPISSSFALLLPISSSFVVDFRLNIFQYVRVLNTNLAYELFPLRFCVFFNPRLFFRVVNLVFRSDEADVRFSL